MTTDTIPTDSENSIQERRLLVQIRLSVGSRGRPERIALLNAMRLSRGAATLTETEAVDLAEKTVPPRVEPGPGDIAMDAESAKALTWVRLSPVEWLDVERRRQRQIAARQMDLGF